MAIYQIALTGYMQPAGVTVRVRPCSVGDSNASIYLARLAVRIPICAWFADSIRLLVPVDPVCPVPGHPLVTNAAYPKSRAARRNVFHPDERSGTPDRHRRGENPGHRGHDH